MKYKLLVLDVDGTLSMMRKKLVSDIGCPVEGSANGSTYCAGIRQTYLWPDAAGQDA